MDQSFRGICYFLFLRLQTFVLINFCYLILHIFEFSFCLRVGKCSSDSYIGSNDFFFQEKFFKAQINFFAV